jgi:hypothetical protein
MKKLVRLGLLVGAITMCTFATAGPIHAAIRDCSTIDVTTCPSPEGYTTIYCRFMDYPDCEYKCTCNPSATTLVKWRCRPNPDFGTCI